MIGVDGGLRAAHGLPHTALMSRDETPRRAVWCLAILLATAAMLATMPPAGAVVTCRWERIASPSPGDSVLHAVDVTPSGVAFAVGTRTDTPDAVPLFLRWNGAEWERLARPLGLADAYDGVVLSGVAARSSGYAWAVGSAYLAGPEIFQPIAFHWDGTSWAEVPLPHVSDGDVRLWDVATTPGSPVVWAVGSRFDPVVDFRALVFRWDGAAWETIDAGRADARRTGLTDVVALSETDAWASGIESPSWPPAAVVVRWNGEQWRRQETVSFGEVDTDAHGIDVVSQRAAWVVGGAGQEAMVQRRARGWFVETTLDPTTGSDTLFGVYAADADAVWAVGQAGSPQTAYVVRRRSDASWHRSRLPALGASTLEAIDGHGRHDVWAVGWTLGARTRTVTLHRC